MFIDRLLLQKFKESVVQTDGNDSLNRNLTLVGHKLVSFCAAVSRRFKSDACPKHEKTFRLLKYAVSVVLLILILYRADFNPILCGKSVLS